MKKYTILLALVALLSLILAACENMTPEQVTSAVSTVENLSPVEMAGVVATIQNLPAEEAAALEQIASNVQLDPSQVTAVVGTVEASIATATAVGQAAASGERVNATQSPDNAPEIIYFFASAPSQSSIQGGVRYHLNWTTENATRVEIYGNVMKNPTQGSWPVYNESNDWVLWAGNDQVWVEQFLKVEADKDLGASLQNVTVDSSNVTLTLRDPQFVDGDKINVLVNGQVVLENYFTQGRYQGFPITLNSGGNTVEILTQNEGVTSPMVAEISVSNVTSGPATQITPGMAKGNTASFTITAP